MKYNQVDNLLERQIFSGQVLDLRPSVRKESLLVLFFKKEQDSSFVLRKRSKKTLFFGVVFGNPGLGRKVTGRPSRHSPYAPRV